MNFILSYVEKMPLIPDHYNVLVAQIISAIAFLVVLFLLARAAPLSLWTM